MPDVLRPPQLPSPGGPAVGRVLGIVLLIALLTSAGWQHYQGDDAQACYFLLLILVLREISRPTS